MKKRLILVPGLISLVALIAACGGGGDEGTGPGGSAPAATAEPAAATTPAGPSDAELVALGKKEFATCAGCHAADATGVTGLGKNLVGSDFIDKISDDDLAAFIKTGRPVSDPANTTGIDMPPKGGNPALTDEKIEALVAYIRSLQ